MIRWIRWPSACVEVTILRRESRSLLFGDRSKCGSVQKSRLAEQGPNARRVHEPGLYFYWLVRAVQLEVQLVVVDRQLLADMSNAAFPLKMLDPQRLRQ